MKDKGDNSGRQKLANGRVGVDGNSGKRKVDMRRERRRQKGK